MDREPPLALSVVCRCCHRQERWTSSVGRSTDIDRQVVLAGGARSVPDPGRRAFEILLASARGEAGPVVAVCPACEQPMTVAPAPAGDASPTVASIAYGIPTPRGSLTYNEAGLFVAPEGVLSEEQARAWIDRALPPQADDDQRQITWFEGGILLLMAAPFLVWVGTAFFVILFLSRFELPVVP